MTKRNTDRWALVSGTLCTPDVFVPVMQCLGVASDQCRFIEVGAPGVADYDVPLRQAVRAGEIVCGFSLGALVLAHNLGALEGAKAVVLLACKPFPDPKGDRANREAVRDRVLAGNARGWVTENWGAMSAGTSAALRDHVAAMAEGTAHLVPAQTELAASRPGAGAELAATALPLVFVTGADDRLTPPDPIRRLVKNAEHAVLEVLDGLGHFALIEAPKCVAVAILHVAVHMGLGLKGAVTNGVTCDLHVIDGGLPVLAGDIGPSDGLVHARCADRLRRRPLQA